MLHAQRKLVFYQATMFALNQYKIPQCSCYLLNQSKYWLGQRTYSVFKEFQDKIKEETEKNPEMKKTLEQLQQQGQQLSDKGKQVVDKVSQASAAASEKISEAGTTISQKISKVTSQIGSTVSQVQETASQTLKSSGIKFDSGSRTESQAQSDESGQTQETVSGEQQKKRSGFASRFRSFKFSMPTGGGVTKLQTMLRTIGREVADAVLPREEVVSSTKVRENVWKPPAEADPSAPSGITVVPKKESVWQQKFNAFRERFASHALFRSLGRIKDSKIVAKTAELAEDVRERFETSDSPTVNRVLDAHDKFFSETEIQRAYRKLLERDNNFDMVKFLSSLKVDVPVVVKAYLEAQEEVLKQHCSKEMVERLMGIAKAEHKQGRFTDSTILELGEVELMPEGLKLLDDQPVVIVQFNCQQVHCVRDKFGNVLEGGPDNIQRVFYLWALRQEEHGAVTNNGEVLPPRWQIIDMMIRGMQHLL
eukprot:TRINITY_DN38439_c0_g1_i4.p1 TRINITY_DN38439_c0_g1~~TRINITY_DN38439_c0_g1_i4.p1  ORF type:complete len:479 (+),score=67.01 TRINITY_DN38439_c0_g1_i4:44-1480(+)